MTPGRWGLLAEFESAEALLRAACAAREAGWRQAQAYAPFDMEGLEEALGLPAPRSNLATLLGALAGGVAGYGMQWYAAVVDLPLDIGGRPPHSWPMFIPISFELTILGGALGAVLAFLAGARLPSLDHPVFGAPDFERASRDGFFLALPRHDPAFEAGAARALLQRLGAVRIRELDGVRP